MRNRLVYLSRILLILYILALCFCCFWNFGSSIDLNDKWLGLPGDKIAHFLMFLPFPAVCYLAFPGLRNTPVKMLRFLALVFFLGIATGMATEAVQGLLKYRSKDPDDLIADILGITAATVMIIVYEAYVKKRGDKI